MSGIDPVLNRITNHLDYSCDYKQHPEIAAGRPNILKGG